MVASLLLTACHKSGLGGREAKPVRFGEPTEPLVLAAAPVALLIGDFDHDPQWNELLVLFEGAPWGTLFPNDLKGGFAAERATQVDLAATLPPNTPFAIRQAAAVDLDGDGVLELAVLNGPTGHLILFRNTPEHGFTPITALPPPWGEGPPARAVGFALGRFDWDQQMDVVVATPTAGFFSYRQGQEMRWRRDPQPLQLGQGVEHILAGDFLLRGADDLVTLDSEGLRLVRRNSRGVFVPDPDRTLPVSDAASAQTPDFNGDGFIDLAVARPDRGEVGLWLMDVDRAWVPNRPASIELPSPVAVAGADVTGDGRIDLVIASRPDGSGPARLWIVPQRE